jgi:hypothetical protein
MVGSSGFNQLRAELFGRLFVISNPVSAQPGIHDIAVIGPLLRSLLDHLHPFIRLIPGRSRNSRDN